LYTGDARGGNPILGHAFVWWAMENPIDDTCVEGGDENCSEDVENEPD
jgi:hypothetical protein